MRIARQHILIFQHRRVNRFALGIINLGDARWCIPHKLGIVKLMSTIFFSVEHKLPIAQREFTVCPARRNLIGQHTTHLIRPIIRHNLLAEVHHTPTFSHYPTPFFSIFLDSQPARFVSDEGLQMLLGIATRQIEQIDTLE